MRIGKVNRKTNETKIDVEINLDDAGKSEIDSGIGFFNHMLNLFAAHGQFGLKVFCAGDLEVDGHHSVEDIGISLGAALKEALGDKRGINRYGTFFLP
ncbi:MAG: imidazoleglycerol-phosphate dehydratase, partial [Selenomonadaceae bacterium]|nr:imidazoleglycerol-phosphate dehydratase [Selenomonadaceae bacterium]